MAEVREEARGSAPTKGGSPSPTKVVRTVRVQKKASIWSDPVTRVLGVIFAVIIVGALLTVVTALLNGTINLSGAPQTASQQELGVTKSSLDENEEDPDKWQEYIIALLNNNRVTEAKEELARAQKANLDVTKGDNLLYLEGLIAAQENQDDKAIELFTQVAKNTDASYKEEYENGPEDQNWAKAYGRHENYVNSLYMLTSLYMDQDNWEAALSAADQYLDYAPTDAGMLIDRGKIEVNLGDYDAARKDFSKALKFLPDDPEATKELQNIEGK